MNFFSYNFDCLKCKYMIFSALRRPASKALYQKMSFEFNFDTVSIFLFAHISDRGAQIKFIKFSEF